MAKARTRIGKAGSDKLSQVANELVDGKPEKKQRTVFLNDENFLLFQEFCEQKGVKPAHLFDRWIEEFLKEQGKL